MENLASKHAIRNLTIAIAFLGLANTVGAQEQSSVRFNRDIRPILSRHCTTCHGPDESSRQADLRLDTFEGATEYAIDPGDADFSELIERVESADNPMPPAEHGERLTDKEIRLLRQWIDAGARYETHWSFVKPVRPSIPGDVDDSLLHPIDRFVVAKARQPLQGQANPARLMRRLALDLTGLPPSHSQVDRFVANPTNANYEGIVDELLQQDTFGEHWASMWLDLARYADTVGYASDENRTIWPWRDWLIQALNNNMPFDQFTRELLAGDLLTNPTVDQRLATAFHRNTLNNNEGGTNDEEFRTISVKDRISTTLNTWMGLTIRCAECHSHKYDPISHTEYHQFLDFFNQTTDADRGDERPLLSLSPARLDPNITEIDQQIQDLQRQLQVANKAPVWTTTAALDPQSTNGTRLNLQADQSVLASGPNPESETFSLSFRLPPGKWTGLRIDALTSSYHGHLLGRGDRGAFVMTQVKAAIQQGDLTKEIGLSSAVADYAQPNFEAKYLIRDSVDQSDEPKGWAVQHAEQGFTTDRFVVVQFAEPVHLIRSTESTSLTVQLAFTSKWPRHSLGRFRISFTQVPNPVDKFRQGQLEPLANRIRQLTRQRNRLIPVPILEELPKQQRRVTRLMKRGNFQNLGDTVQAAVPNAFHPFPEDAPNNRLGVAQWLTDRDNPLTARVAVNRHWARLFGKGIVVTEEDFGTQGTPPTHPQLLDWLAVDFQSDWNVKRSLKQIVMSATYRQSSRSTPEQLAADPDNVLLTRGPRVRLPAEAIRDQALSVSGLLSDKMYGPPVYPPNPVKQIANAFSNARPWQTSQGADRYRRSIYTFLKRSQPHPLFETFDTATRDVCSLRRINTNTPLQSFMTLNDEAFVEAAQALAARMDKEASDSRMSGDADSASNPGQRAIEFGLQTALLHPADPQQTQVLLDLYLETLARYSQNPDQATLMIGKYAEQVAVERHPQLAALTVVANVILNLDEFLTH